MLFYNVEEIRNEFKARLSNEDFVIDKSGVKTLEIIGACFIADEESIFGKPSADYISREIDWYLSQSLKVSDIPGGTPQIWLQVASKTGEINSNYGWAIFSKDNGSQYLFALNALQTDENTRRAIMIYTRPSMQWDYKRDGMSDFMCTNTVQYFIRDGYLHAVVNMRSNDAVFGYKNDRAWQLYVLRRLLKDINSVRKDEDKILEGDIIWQTGSLHVYERHFGLIA
jgi:thymidylate synthase